MRNDMRHLVYAVVLVALGAVLHNNLKGQMGLALGSVLYVLGGYFVLMALMEASRPRREVVEVRRVPVGPFWNPGWWGGVYRAPPIRRWRRRWRRRFW